MLSPAPAPALVELSAELIAKQVDLHTSSEVDIAALPQENRRTTVPTPELAEGLYRVRAERIPDLTDALAKLDRKALRLGLPLVAVETVAVDVLPVVAYNQRQWARTGELRAFHILRPSLTPIRLDGWTFAATIEHLREEDGSYSNVVKASPTFKGSLPLAYRTDAPTCEHCGKVRSRLETFVVQHTDGALSRVGRNCLGAFIGDDNAAALVLWATFEASLIGELFDDGEGGCYGGTAARVFSPRTFLGATALVIEQDGWVSRKVAQMACKRATADAARDVVDPPKKYEGPRVDAISTVHYADADAALDWARNIPADTTSDFLYNCRTIARLAVWDYTRLGIGAAILMSYQKEQERLKRAEFERRLPSTFVGEVGTRFGGAKKGSAPALTARVLGVHAVDGQFGVTTIVRMQTPAADGASVHDIVWFASGTVSVTLLSETIEARKVAFEQAESACTDARRAFDAYDEEANDMDLWTTLRDAYYAAQDALSAAKKALNEETRSVAAGDLVQVTGSVKRQEVSKRTQRPETTLTRCTLTLVRES